MRASPNFRSLANIYREQKNFSTRQRKFLINLFMLPIIHNPYLILPFFSSLFYSLSFMIFARDLDRVHDPLRKVPNPERNTILNLSEIFFFLMKFVPRNRRLVIFLFLSHVYGSYYLHINTLYYTKQDDFYGSSCISLTFNC